MDSESDVLQTVVTVGSTKILTGSIGRSVTYLVWLEVVLVDEASACCLSTVELKVVVVLTMARALALSVSLT